MDAQQQSLHRIDAEEAPNLGRPKTLDLKGTDPGFARFFRVKARLPNSHSYGDSLARWSLEFHLAFGDQGAKVDLQAHWSLILGP